MKGMKKLKEERKKEKKRMVGDGSITGRVFHGLP